MQKSDVNVLQEVHQMKYVLLGWEVYHSITRLYCINYILMLCTNFAYILTSYLHRHAGDLMDKRVEEKEPEKQMGKIINIDGQNRCNEKY